MSDSGTTSYDEFPYESHAYQETHPDRIATLAILFGLEPPPLERCRVLELGCAGGGNLIPMASTLPEARFVGVDLSARQVDEARELVAKLGLSNVELRAGSITDIDESAGQFDYIICHGVYSWVPEEVQRAILDICRRNLSPSGVAFISYNVRPGWHEREKVREMMLYHIAGVEDPRERVRLVREFLRDMLLSVPQGDGAFGRELHEVAAGLRDQGDYYVLHEYLEEVNRPIYFHEFLDRIAGHGLQYVADARYRTMPEVQPPEVRAALDRFSTDPLRREQYHDFVRNRTFRRSLICHADRSVRRPASPEAVEGLLVRGNVGPAAPNPDIYTNAAVEFRSGDVQGVLRTNSPLIKAALIALTEQWPRAVTVAELRRLALDKLQSPPVPNPAPIDNDPRVLPASLLQAFGSGIVELAVHDPSYAIKPGSRPAASPLARLQAEAGYRVTSLLHRMVQLSAFERLVLRHLNGTKDRAAIVDALVAAVVDGSFQLQQEGRSIRDPMVARPILGRSLEPCLARLGRSSLLIG